MNIRPRRSVLYMPGSNPRAIEKAKTLACDGIIIDLEDAVAPEAKKTARSHVAQTVKAGGFGRREVFIRVNGPDTAWFPDDMDAALHAAPDAILVPKVSMPETLDLIGKRMLGMQAGAGVHIWAMIETPAAIFNAPLLAAMARDSETRLAGFVIGTNDLAKESRARLVPGRAPMTGWLSNCVLAAHAYGIDILDGVHNDISDAEGFMAECIQGRDLGFDGKTLIHPSQIDACNAAFSPTPEEIAQARLTVSAFEKPENRDRGAIALNGRMVERMHADMARRTLAIAEAIGAPA
jgi:citrate lyase subunit beta/citryl-CoA lyase